MRSLSSTSAAGGVGWLVSASAAGRRGGMAAADLPGACVACPVMMRRGAICRGDDVDGVAGVDGAADGILVTGVTEGAGVGARRVLMRRLAARARISFMRSMV
jgi:hypothetical protein